MNVIIPKILSSWTEDENKLTKEFTFPDFAKAMAFANQIATLAEQENHHPDLLVSWGKVKVELTTHDTGGISEKDVVLAEKIDMI